MGADQYPQRVRSRDERRAMSPPTTLSDHYGAVIERIRAASRACGRPDDVKLLAVSKTKPAASVMALADLGQHAFGENYIQEGIEKIAACAQAGYRLEWHLVGPIQSNKSRPVAENFDWVQTIDRLKIAQRLSEQRPESHGPLNVCIQVNISAQESKSGCLPEHTEELAQAVARLPQLRLRGLMAIPAPLNVADGVAPMNDETNQQLLAMTALFNTIGRQDWARPGWDTLSMGMTADLELAIAAGSNMVRVGTALFGARQ
jgi:PLP dependent protein